MLTTTRYGKHFDFENGMINALHKIRGKYNEKHNRSDVYVKNY